MADNANFFAILKQARAVDPAAACIESDSGAVYSFTDIDRMSAQYAHALIALGCQPDDRVAVQIDKSPQALALFLACLRAGLIYLPLNTAYRSSELAHFLSDAQPRVFVCVEDTREAMGQLARSTGVASVEGLDQQGGGSLAGLAAVQPQTFELAHRAPQDIAAILYTSGTTGRPKGAMLSHRSVHFCAAGLIKAWEFSSRDVLLHALPIFHAHGLFVSSCVGLLSGAKLLFHGKFDVDAVLNALPRATAMMAVPTIYHRLLADQRLTAELCNGIRLFTSGSSPLSAQVHEQFRKRSGHRILERYGMTETMILTSNPLHGERRPGTVGLPLPEVELRLADQHDQPLSPGQIGMIQVKGPGLFCGYWRMPEKTAQEFTADGFFRTGDLGAQSEDGYMTITGRSKDLIISGGYNVYPAEVEKVLSEHPSVGEAVVFGVPHPDFGEAVTAAVILTASGSAPTELIAWTKSRIANYKVPKHLVIVDQFPRNAMGKVQKNVLRETYAKLGTGTRTKT